MIITKNELDDFVRISDELGEPGTPKVEEYWKDFEYRPSVIVDTEKDPFSDDYVNLQMELYKEISGLNFYETKNEMTNFPLEECVNAANPYASTNITNISKHVNSISKAISLAKLPRGATILDMGSGWGLSTEILSYCGAKVTAVDVNPNFTELNIRRNQRFKFNTISINSSFDDFETTEKYDAIFFYECLHHSIKTWEVIEKYKNFLKDGGAFIISGEPVNNFWWKNWGLRLDAMSIYCIRKHGWFESGWSHDFLMKMFSKLDMSVERIEGVAISGSDVYIVRKFNIK